MDVKTARRVSVTPDRSVLYPRGNPYGKKVCKFWLAGMCNRHRCAFLHLDITHLQPQKQQNQSPSESNSHTGLNVRSSRKNSSHASSNNVPRAHITMRNTWRNPNSGNKKCAADSSNRVVRSEVDSATASSNSVVAAKVNRDEGIQKKFLNAGGAGLFSCGAVSSDLAKKGGTQFETELNVHKPPSQLCKYWVTGNCVRGDKCKDSHSWFCGSGFSMLNNLEGHTKVVSGVVLPSGSDKLFSASKDETIRVWDCHSGQCVNNVKLESEIQCLLSEGPWVFAGLRNAVKAWNFQTQTEHVLNGPDGLVHSLAASDDMVFAGVQNGAILVWKFNFGPDCPQFVANLKGHSLDVLSLVVGAKRLYSGSKDSTIRVWDLESLQCLEIVSGHSDFVTSLLCWNCYLLSGSLDNTVKVWAASESGKLKVVYEVKEASGVIALRGIMDAEDKPILLCSYKDSTVRLYDLPSFVERGRIFGKREVQTIEVGWCGGLFFTGDATGQLSVWKLHGEFKAGAS